MEKKIEIKKIVEIYPMYTGTRSHFYPIDHGGDEGAYKACSVRALEKQIFWDVKFCSWYYYL